MRRRRGGEWQRAYLAGGETYVDELRNADRERDARRPLGGAREDRAAARVAALGPVDETISRRAGELGRRHRGIGVAGLLIAATALSYDATFATANVRHYPTFDGLAAPYPDS